MSQVTSEIVESLPGLLKDCIFGNVFFSRIRFSRKISCVDSFSEIRTGTQIEPHCGPSNVRHRCDLLDYIQHKGLTEVNIRLHFPILVPGRVCKVFFNCFFMSHSYSSLKHRILCLLWTRKQENGRQESVLCSTIHYFIPLVIAVSS